MITQPGWRKDALLKQFVLQAHPIIQTYVQKLKIPELIATYIRQDHRLKLPIEQTLCVLIHTRVERFGTNEDAEKSVGRPVNTSESAV